MKIQLLTLVTVDHVMEFIDSTSTTTQSTVDRLDPSTNSDKPPRKKRNLGTLLKDYENESDQQPDDDSLQALLLKEQQLTYEIKSYSP